jgi:hypothetical protein
MAVDLQTQSGTGNLETFAQQMPSRPAGMKRASTIMRRQRADGLPRRWSGWK